MKRMIMMLLGATLIALNGMGQKVFHFDNKAILPAYSLDITWHKTTLLIFPAAVQSADRGDRYVLAEKVPGVENILKVKAGAREFPESNLQVITTDGKVYSFDVCYADTPAYQTIDLRLQGAAETAATFTGVNLNSSELENVTSKITCGDPFLHGAHDRQGGIRFDLDGIYLQDDVIFFRYWLKNTTAIKYDMGSLRFFIRDKKQAKRTAEQDREILPLYVHYSRKPEFPNGEVIVAAFPKFTIAENKHFVTELTEAGGDRNASCKLNQRKLLKARPLPTNPL